MFVRGVHMWYVCTCGVHVGCVYMWCVWGVCTCVLTSDFSCSVKIKQLGQRGHLK